MASDNRLDLINTANRRGLLLGLTLSEIMMIILFALLLLFGVVFEEQEQDRKRVANLERDHERLVELEPKAIEGETALAASRQMRDILDNLGVLPNEIDEILREMKAAQELREEISRLNAKASYLTPGRDEKDQAQLKKIHSELAAKQTELAKANKKIEELQRKLNAMGRRQRQAAELASAMADIGVTPNQVRQLDKTVSAMKSVLDGMRQQMTKAGLNPEAIQSALDKVAKDWTNAALDNRALAEQGKYWKTKYEADIGNGRKFASPCWATDGEVDPIYDVALTDDGMIVRRFELPQWAEDYERLPTENVKLLQSISQEEFIASTRPLFQYSNKKDCRFFVRIFDETSLNAKITYQRRRRAVEGHFYIIDMKNSRFGDVH